jgi:hypothetical protein
MLLSVVISQGTIGAIFLGNKHLRLLLYSANSPLGHCRLRGPGALRSCSPS